MQVRSNIFPPSFFARFNGPLVLDVDVEVDGEDIVAVPLNLRSKRSQLSGV